MGLPLVAYLRQRRMALARMLLENTNQSVKEIAHACGIPDAQLFNKTVRREFGASPTALRGGAASRPLPWRSRTSAIDV